MMVHFLYEQDEATTLQVKLDEEVQASAADPGDLGQADETDSSAQKREDIVRAKKKATPKQITAATWKLRAQTFETLRVIAEMNLDNTSRSDGYGIDMVKAELKALGIKETHTPFGPADSDNKIYGFGFRAMRFHMWRRKEIWNRLNWLKAELTRLLEGRGSPRGHRRTTENYGKQEMTRAELIGWRRQQITRYLLALDEYAPLHKAIADEKRNRRKRQRRDLAKRARRQAEIQKALTASNTKAARLTT